MALESPDGVKMRDVVVVGSGPAGYTAAIYAARANLNPLLVSGFEEGGQLMTTTDVENYPGFAEGVQGPELMERMKAQVLHVGAEMQNDSISGVFYLDKSKNTFKLVGSAGEYFCRAVIIATGAQAQWLGLPSEMEFRGFGVSGCATCDGFFFKKKHVVVVGGGNTAVEEALYLTKHASKVFLVHRGSKLRAERILQDRLLAHENIEVLWNTELSEVLGEHEPHKSVTAARLKNNQTGDVRDLPISGIFVAIGHKPATEFLAGSEVGIPLDSGGYIVTEPGSSRTSVKGVFACGDVHDKQYRQAVTAAGFGCMAALDVLHYIDSLSS